MGDQNAMLYEYLLSMGAMTPEQEKLKRQQAMVDTLRGNAMQPGNPTQMAGRVVASTGLGDAISRMGQAYVAKQGQGKVDAGVADMNARQKQLLEEMRRRMAGNKPVDPGFTPGPTADANISYDNF